MTAGTLLKELAQRGVILFSPDGERLVFDAPAGELTEADRANIRAHKAELILLAIGPPPHPGAVFDSANGLWRTSDTGPVICTKSTAAAYRAAHSAAARATAAAEANELLQAA